MPAMSNDIIKEPVSTRERTSDHDDPSVSVSAPEKNEVELETSGDDADIANPSKQDPPLQDPPLPQEAAPPPLPLENPPSNPQDDDGWDPVWDDSAQTYYFYNRFSGASQWTNPRVPDSQPVAPGLGNYDRMPDKFIDPAPGTQPDHTSISPARPHGGYDPAIHGDYDPNAPYAQDPQTPLAESESAMMAGAGASAGVAGLVSAASGSSSAGTDPNAIYTATGVFNRFTGKWQAHTLTPETYNDDNKSKRQMSAFFDVDAAANSHNGKSLKAERSGKKLTKQELKAFKEKRKEKKEEKRRAWLRD